MTRAIVTLALVVSITYAVRTYWPPGGETLAPGVTLAGGFLLIAAIQAGHILGRLKFPHMTGFILAGLIFGPEVLGFMSHRAVESLSLVKGVSVGFIGLLAGCELNIARLRPRLRAVLSYTGIAILFAGLSLFAAFFVITGMLPATSSLTTLQRMTIALVCANVLSAFSPPVVIGILSEARAKGPMSDLWISIAVVNNLVIVIAFSITDVLVRRIFPAGRSPAHLRELLLQTFGSFGAGIVVGILLVWYVRMVGARLGLFVFMLLFVIAEAGTAIHLNALLVGLAAGLFLENVTPVGGTSIAEASEPVTLPMYAIFFAVIGAEIDLRAFAAVAPFAIVAASVRAFALISSTRVAGRRLRADSHEIRLVPYGMFPQAGVALALATLVLTSSVSWGSVIGTVLLGSIVVKEMIGPVLLRFAVQRSGEAAAEDQDLTLRRRDELEEMI